VQFVIDTGADVTILSYRVYKELNRLDEIERLTADGVLKGLDGGRIEVVGTATLDFFLGEICVRQQVWIAEIKEDCILGADFLMKQECVIDYPQNVLLIGSTEVPMHANTDELKCLRIVLDRTIKVPGNSEIVISAKLDGTPGEANCGAIGPAAITRRTKGIIVS
jgi:predicted aspartyl protease